MRCSRIALAGIGVAACVFVFAFSACTQDDDDNDVSCASAGCDGDDDVTDDDTFYDNDDMAECSGLLSGKVEACFPGEVTGAICMRPEGACWVGCYSTTESCETWRSCVDQSCETAAPSAI